MTTQPVVSTIKGSNSAHSSNGSRCSSDIGLPPDYDCDLNDEDGTTDEPDPDPDLRRRRRHTQPQLIRSPSLFHPLPLPTKQENQIQAPEMNCSVDDEDPFKKLGLKPYSPIWLPSRTPSFETMRQRSYSPNPRHGMNIRPSPVHDGDDVIGKDDRDILGFDLHEPFKEEDKSNKKNLTTAAGKERQEPGSSRLYERFGSIKKRSSPLLPDHYDDLEDYDAEEVNFQMADAKTSCMSTTKRPRRDHAQDQSQVGSTTPGMDSNLATVAMAMRGTTDVNMKECSLDEGEDVVAVLVVGEDEDEEAMIMLNSTIDTTSLLAKVAAME
ncbi:hypothetical protein KI688_010443 [Linnemannia hyalina]|uniref:Uncharacterized protein n=1 Tax=Linnemannia hyalina TaxID=64524 RepID=A0A9P7XY69_9FUNG|nr:hypothetical protein KI688_010443 [Linnemannia hyalina]